MKKTNKTFKRFAAITSASLLAACMVAPMSMNLTASAVDGSNSITIDNEVASHTYQAYQIFDGTLSTEGGILSNIEWGEGVVITDAALEELAALNSLFAKSVTYSIPDTQPDLIAEYESWRNTQLEENASADVSETAYFGTIVNEDTKNLFEKTNNPYTLADEKVASKIAEALSEYGDAKSFADVISKYLTIDETKIKTSTYSDANKNHVIGALDDGYYLVQDDMNEITGTETATRYIVYVLGNETVAPKSSKPEMEKKVAENEEDKYADEAYENGIYTAPEEYNDVADWNIGDDVPFELIGTMPSDIGEYKEYYYQFTDTLADGLTLNESSISVKLVNPDSDDADEKPDESVATGYTVSADEDGHGFTITFNNIKNSNLITKDTVVVVDYTAELNSEAKIGLDGNLNTANLKYSNNPNWKGKGEEGTTSETPNENAIVFTYELDVDKIAKGSPSTKLFAEFVLYRNVDGVEYAKLDENNKVSAWVTDEEEATVLKTKNETGVYETIKVIGLDDGDYYLKETKEPDGYNLPTSPFDMIIEAETDNSQDWDETDAAVPNKALTKLTLNTDVNGALDTGIVATSIENTKGNELPGTGGIGTTIFYLGGGAMAAIGGVYLISKRRMKKSEE